MPVVLAPLLSDAPIVTLVLVLLARVPPALLGGLQVAGGGYLIYLATRAVKAARHYEQARRVAVPVHQTILRAATVNLLNPNPYLAWTLVLGPLLLRAWHESPAYGAGLVAAFYASMVLATAAFVMALGGARSLGTRVAQSLVGISAVALSAFGLYELWAGMRVLLGSA
jgi:threonine/homoserine/homoserine lactone efflux protein